MDWPRGWMELAIAIRNVFAAENGHGNGPSERRRRPLRGQRSTLRSAFKMRYQQLYS